MERVPPETARDLLLAETQPLSGETELDLQSALGRVLSRDCYAPLDNPPFDRSPLDGFALRSVDTAGASDKCPARLSVAATIFAGGRYEGALGAGEAVRLMTGAPIPEGADCVIGKEEVILESEGTAVIARPVSHHENYVFKGEDVKKGTLLFPTGTLLKSGHLGVLASMGFEKITVRRLPVIGLFCTGDELVPLGSPLPLPPGKIFNSNETLLAARLLELGLPAVILPKIEDNTEYAAKIIEEQIDRFDLLITTGAVSVGDKDFFHEVFERLNIRRVFYRLASRPGNAALTGVYRDKLLLCLSGNPFAAILSFELLARPVLAKMTGRNDIDVRYTDAVLDTPFSKQAGIRRFIRAHLENGKVTLPGGNSSGQLFSFASCNCLLDAAAEIESINQGERVRVLLLDNRP